MRACVRARACVCAGFNGRKYSDTYFLTTIRNLFTVWHKELGTVFRLFVFVCCSVFVR